MTAPGQQTIGSTAQNPPSIARSSSLVHRQVSPLVDSNLASSSLSQHQQQQSAVIMQQSSPEDEKRVPAISRTQSHLSSARRQASSVEAAQQQQQQQQQQLPPSIQQQQQQQPIQQPHPQQPSPQHLAQSLSPYRSPARFVAGPPRGSPRSTTQRAVDLSADRDKHSPSPNLSSPYLSSHSLYAAAAVSRETSANNNSNSALVFTHLYQSGNVTAAAASVTAAAAIFNQIQRPLTASGGGSSSSPPNLTLISSLTPPHCFLYEEGWFALTSPALLRNQYAPAADLDESLQSIPMRSIQVGPFSRNILTTMFRNQHLSPSCLVWHEHIHSLLGSPLDAANGWVPISKVSLLQTSKMGLSGLNKKPAVERERNSLTSSLLPTGKDTTTNIQLPSSSPTALHHLNFDNDPIQSSPLLLHALLMEELLEHEEEYVSELQTLLNIAQNANSATIAATATPAPSTTTPDQNPAAPAAATTTNNSATFLQVLKRFVPLLTKLHQTHSTFIAAIQNYVKSLYQQIQQLQLTQQASQAGLVHFDSVYLPPTSNKSLLFSPYLSFLPLEIPRASAARGAQIELEEHKRKNSADESTTAAGDKTDSSRQYYQYVFLLAKLLKESRVFPYSAHLKPGPISPFATNSNNTAAGANKENGAEAVAADQLESVFAALSATASDEITTTTNTPGSATTSAASASSIQSLFQHGLTALLSSFHTSLRTRKHKMRLAIASQVILGPTSLSSAAYNNSSNTGNGYQIPSGSSSNRSSGPRSAQRSPLVEAAGSFEQMWNSNSMSPLNSHLPPPATSGAVNNLSSIPAASLGAGLGMAEDDGANVQPTAPPERGWRGSLVRNKRSSISSLSQISEGKELPIASSKAKQAEAATSATPKGNRVRGSIIHTAQASLGVMSIQEQSMLLRPVYQIAFYGCILKELLTLHSSSPAANNSSATSFGCDRDQPLVSGSELEDWWKSFYNCSFLLAHHWNEEQLRKRFLKLFVLERLVFCAPLDEIVVKNRICSPLKPRRQLKRSGEIGVMFQLNGAGGLPPSIISSSGIAGGTAAAAAAVISGQAGPVVTTQIVFFTWFLMTDLLICGKKLQGATGGTLTSPTAAASNAAAAAAAALLPGSSSSALEKERQKELKEEREKVGPCSYQQAFMLDGNFSVRVIDSVTASRSSKSSSASTPTNRERTYPALEIRTGSRSLALYFRSERSRSAWLRSITEAMSESRDPASAESLPTFPAATNLTSALQPLFSGGAQNGGVGAVRLERCNSCAGFLLPGYRNSVWCNICAKMVCSECCSPESHRGPSSSPLATRVRASLFLGSDSGDEDESNHRRGYDDDEDEVLDDPSIVAEDAPASTDSCLICRPIKQHWPDLSSSHFPDLASAEYLAKSSSASAGAETKDESAATTKTTRSKPDGVRRISSSRDSNGREVVSTLLGGSGVVLAPVAAAAVNTVVNPRRASQSNLPSTHPALSINLNLHSLNGSQPSLPNGGGPSPLSSPSTQQTPVSARTPSTQAPSSAHSSGPLALVLGQAIPGSSPKRQEGFKPINTTAGTSLRSSLGQHSSGLMSGGSSTAASAAASGDVTPRGSSSAQASLSSTPSGPHRKELQVTGSGLSMQLLNPSGLSLNLSSSGQSSPMRFSGQRSSTRSSEGASPEPITTGSPEHHAPLSSHASSHTSSHAGPHTPSRIQSSGVMLRLPLSPFNRTTNGDTPLDGHSPSPRRRSPAHSSSLSSGAILSPSSASAFASTSGGAPRSNAAVYENLQFPRSYLDYAWEVTVPRAREVEQTGKNNRHTTYDIILKGTMFGIRKERGNSHEMKQPLNLLPSSSVLLNSPSSPSLGVDTPFSTASASSPNLSIHVDSSTESLELGSSKRYSEFQAFDSNLRKIRKASQHQRSQSASSGVSQHSSNSSTSTATPNSGSVSVFKMPSLPPTTIFDRFSPQLLEERRACFEVYLNTILHAGDDADVDHQLKIAVLTFLLAHQKQVSPSVPSTPISTGTHEH